MKKLLAVAFSVIFLIACTDRDDEVEDVNIRVRNLSALTFDRVQVGETDKVHEMVSPDAFTEYLSYEEAYRYAYIEIQSGTETYVLQPIDFVGESPLPIGLYTYELDISGEGEVLLNFVVD